MRKFTFSQCFIKSFMYLIWGFRDTIGLASEQTDGQGHQYAQIWTAPFFETITPATPEWGPYSLRTTLNKRAQRGLDRSPEEKIKGHSGAIYSGPLMLSTKNWYRTSRWCYTSNMKALGLVVSDKKIFKQKGPKGPRSLTWGKGQGSRWSHLQRTTNVVHQILVEDF